VSAMGDVVLEAGAYREPPFEGLRDPAVLVVDLTNDFCHPQGVYARHGAACEPVAGVVGPARALLEAAAAAKAPTILVTQVIYQDRFGRAVAGGGLVEGRPWLADEGFRQGSWGVQMIDELPRTDYVIEKTRASGFHATPLEVLLRGLGVRTLVVVGAFTNQCVETTVRDAWARDFRVVVATDAVAAFDPALHAATLESLKPLARQLPAAEIVRLLAPAGPR
jgi:ureidoacrylate peracid hydrolase